MSTQNSMFGGSQTKSTARKQFTGLASLDLLMLNPTKEEIESAIGRPYNLPVDYSVRDIQGRQLRPIEFWVKETSGQVEPLPLRFLIGRDQDINQNGTIRFINAVGDFAQGKSDEALTSNEKMAWFTKHAFRPAIVGEYELYSFMQKLMRYNSRDEGAAFVADLEKNDMTIEQLFEGNLRGLQQFFSWTKENNNRITAPLAVRKQEKVDETGVKTYYNQAIVNNPQYMYTNSTGEVSPRAIQTLEGEIAKGRRVTTMLFTVNFQEFSEKDCVNTVPADSATPASGSNLVNPSSWLN